MICPSRHEWVAGIGLQPRNTGPNRSGARKKLVQAVGERYRLSDTRSKGRVLDDFAAATGLHRKHAMRRLRAKGPAEEGAGPSAGFTTGQSERRSIGSNRSSRNVSRATLRLLPVHNDRFVGTAMLSVDRLRRAGAFNPLGKGALAIGHPEWHGSCPFFIAFKITLSSIALIIDQTARANFLGEAHRMRCLRRMQPGWEYRLWDDEGHARPVRTNARDIRTVMMPFASASRNRMWQGTPICTCTTAPTSIPITSYFGR